VAWLTLTATVPGQQAEILSDMLMEFGALSVDVHDADADTPEEQAVFGEPGEPVPHLWPHNRVTALFPEGAQIDAVMQQVAHALGLERLPPHRIGTLEDNDWVRLTQSQFEPIPVSQRLWVVPTWHAPSDLHAINIVLDPGLAFGTGSHPTTRLCLRWLDANIKGGESVLDYGCGSGILAIAALKLGAGSAIGVDVDMQAVQASRDNAAANQVAAEFFLPDEAPKQPADIVIANILTNPLRMLAPLLAATTRQGGCIVLSGILSEQSEEVMKIYAQWFNLAPTIMDEGWACVSGVKR
jgi:ribosomal protein L11 methyltransferase